MKKQLLTYLILLVYLISLIKPVYPVINYAINYDYIANFLCINKEKPASTCNGKCQVIKQLDNNKTNQQKELQLNDFEFDKYLKILNPNYQLQYTSFKKYQFFYKENYEKDYHKEIFHPPINIRTI